MSSRRETSVDIWKLALRLSKNGKSYRNIAKIIGQSHTCVQKIICKYKRGEGLEENKNRRGRKEILSNVAKKKNT